MSDNPTDIPQEEVPQQQPDQVPQQEPPVQQPEPQPEPPQVTDWRDRRIGEQQQRLRERNARIAELEAQLSAYAGTAQQGYQPNGAAPAPNYGSQPVGDIQQRINEAAAQMAAAAEFTRRCNEVADSGRKVYQNFDNRVQRLTGLVDSNDAQQVAQYNAFLTAAMETGQADKLIYELGGDLNEASRIMALSPVKMAVELTKMSTRPPTDASGAPRPLSPVASASQANRTTIAPDDAEGADALSTEEWMRRREEQVQGRRQRTLG